MHDPEALFAVLAGDGHLASFHTHHVDADEEAKVNGDEFGGEYRVVEYTPSINATFAATKALEAEAEADRYRGLLIEALWIAENATSHAGSAGNDRLAEGYKAAGDRIRAALFPDGLTSRANDRPGA